MVMANAGGVSNGGNETGDEEDDDKKGDPSARSQTPYPSHGLGEAVAFADAVFKVGGNEASGDAVRAEIGLKSNSSAGWSYRVSAAREFGVIERPSRAEDRIRVSDLYKRYAQPVDERERRATLMQIFLRPMLYGRLIQRFAGAPVPSVEGLANLLQREFGLVEARKTAAAKAFISSLQFAGLISPDNRVIAPRTDAPVEAEPAQAAAPPVTSDAAVKPAAEAPPQPEVPANFILHTVQLRKGMLIKVSLPADISTKDVERLHKWLKTLPFEEDAVAPTTEGGAA